MLGREHRQVRLHHRVPDHWGQQEAPSDVFCAMKEVARIYGSRLREEAHA